LKSKGKYNEKPKAYYSKNPGTPQDLLEGGEVYFTSQRKFSQKGRERN